jgi:hypothetical protein
MAIRRTQRDDTETGSDIVRSQRFGEISRQTDGPVANQFKRDFTNREFQARGSAGGRTAARRPPARGGSEGPTRQQLQTAAKQLPNVSRPDASGPQPDTAANQAALLAPGAGIAGLSDTAVAQEGANFDSVTDPGSGFTVPNQADPQTRESFNRFFKGGKSQKGRDADPTRVAFQNRFFPSETLKDAGVGNNRRF